MNDLKKNYIPKDIDRRTVPLWYAIYVRSRHEKKVAEELEERKIEYFLPLVSRLRQWKDRKKMVAIPLFPGYVFVHIKLADKLNVLSVDGVVWLVSFQNQPAAIPESQIMDVKKLLSHSDKIEPWDYIKEGQLVEIIYGPFSGVSGRLIQHRGKRRLIVGIDLINQAITIEIDMSWIKPLKEKPNAISNYSNHYLQF